jgi:alpha-tubulin suppressor-like RCC1 family protein
LFICFITDGKVYTLGDGTRGQLGNGEDIQKCKRPELVSFFKKKTVFMVSAGECQTAFVTGNNQTKSLGRVNLLKKT